MGNILLLCLVISSIMFYILCDIDIEQDQKLQKEGLKCGIQNKLPATKQTMASRILNGKPTSNKQYPWLAQIHLKMFRADKKRILSTWGISGGSIISSRSILTCLHCVCQAEPAVDEYPTCLEDNSFLDKKKVKVNQNKQGRNEVYYTIGRKGLDATRATYNENIKAYIFSTILRLK